MHHWTGENQVCCVRDQVRHKQIPFTNGVVVTQLGLALGQHRDLAMAMICDIFLGLFLCKFECGSSNVWPSLFVPGSYFQHMQYYEMLLTSGHHLYLILSFYWTVPFFALGLIYIYIYIYIYILQASFPRGRATRCCLAPEAD